MSTPTVTRCSIEHVPVGRLGPNVGISALSVREADALGLAEIYIAVTSDLEEPSTEIEVELSIDGQLQEVVPFDLPAEGEAKRLLRVPLPPGRRVTARVRNVKGDTLAADDVAWAPRRIGGRVRTLLVTSTRLSFTAEALRLHPRVDLSVIGPNDATPTEPFDLVVMEAERDVAALPEATHLVALGPPAATMGFAVAKAEVEGAEIVRWSFDDPCSASSASTMSRSPTPRSLPWARVRPRSSTVDRARWPWPAASVSRIASPSDSSPTSPDFVLRVGFVNLMANLGGVGRPPQAVVESEDAESFAMPSTESHVDPPPQISGTTRGEFSGPVRTRMAMWRLLAWLAGGLIAFEWLLPAFAFGLGLAWARIGPRVRRGSGRRSERTSS